VTVAAQWAAACDPAVRVAFRPRQSTEFTLDRLDKAIASRGPSRTPLGKQGGQVGLPCAGAHVIFKRLG